MSPIKAYAALSTAVQSSGDTLPDSIQWMPPGRHSITAVKDGEPFEMEIEVNEALARRVAAMLQHYRDKAARAEGDLPFFDFNHNDAEASAHPLQMYWAGDDPRQGGIRARLQWTGAGADAIRRRTFRRFSPEFLTDDDKNVIGVGINMGGLVNRAAFRNIQPIWSRDAAPSPVPCSEFRVPGSKFDAGPEQLGTRNSELGTEIPEHASRITHHASHPPMDPSQIQPGDLAVALTQLSQTVAAQGHELKVIRATLAEAAKATPPKSVSGSCDLGSTGHWPVPSGDPPDGMVQASPANEDGLKPGAARLVPVGGSPTGTGGSPGGSPVLPSFQTRSEPRILELEQALAAAAEANQAAARAQAERAVAAAAADGKFPPQDKEVFRHLVDVFAANPDAGKVLLARMPVNPALQTLVTTGAAGRTTLGHAEPAMQFAALVKARANQFNGDRSRAIDAVIAESPELYKAWRDANGQPQL